MDMNHGLFFTSPVKIYAGNYSDCAGSDLIVITAGARQKPGRLGLNLREEMRGYVGLSWLGPYIGEANILVITNEVCLSVPCLGIEHAVETILAEDEIEGLANSAEVLKSAILALG